MKQPFLDCLLDGQIESKVSFWQQRLREDPSDALSVCCSLFRGSSVPEACLSEWNRESAAFLMLAERFFIQLSQAMEAIPRQKGFFTSAEDRRKAYGIVCQLLTGAEETKQELQERLGRFSVWETFLQQRQKVALQAEEHLRTAKQVASFPEIGGPLAELSDLLERLLAENLIALEMAQRIEALRCAADDFCHRDLPSFAVGLQRAAGLGNEGEGCRIAEVLRLCEECGKSVHGFISQSRGSVLGESFSPKQP